MTFQSKTCDVKGGRFRATCTRCQRKRWVVVPSGIRKKTIRCLCGLSASYTLNHRMDSREVTSGKAMLLFGSGREVPAYLCDMSLGGVGFTLAPQYVRMVRNNQEISLKYRSMAGGIAIRKVLVTSISGTRVGGQYIDGFVRIKSI